MNITMAGSLCFRLVCTAAFLFGGCSGQAESTSGETGGVSSVCTRASECPNPPDFRCGYAECKEGKCLLVITPGPTNSQKRGDCKTLSCDTEGHAKEVEDPGDFYDDGNPCTYDFCVSGTRKNEAHADGVACSAGAVHDGICYVGRCVECYDTAPLNYCPSGLACDWVQCVSMQCELDQTCGDQCRPCQVNGWCNADSDCESGVCDDNFCAAPTCEDGVRNDKESDVDCGADGCTNKCGDGWRCAYPEDCISGVCWAGSCQAPTCTDGVHNGDEDGIDCGAGCPLPCKAGN